MAHRGWDVFLRGKHIDTVFFDKDIPAEDVKRSLVNHDGYDPAIKVRSDAPPPPTEWQNVQAERRQMGITY